VNVATPVESWVEKLSPMPWIFPVPWGTEMAWLETPVLSAPPMGRESGATARVRTARDGSLEIVALAERGASARASAGALGPASLRPRSPLASAFPAVSARASRVGKSEPKSDASVTTVTGRRHRLRTMGRSFR
jgi:hypothetical protein